MNENKQGQKMSTDKQKLILEHDKIAIDDQMQQTLNKPLEAGQTQISDEDRKFLAMLLDLIDSKKIDLYKPSTLINNEVYDTLDEKARGKTDFDAVNLLSTIREIKKLCDGGFRDSYQTMNMVNQIRLTKERLEEIAGDIYII